MSRVRRVTATVAAAAAAIAVALGTVADEPPPSPAAPTLADLRYAGDDDPAHRLDLYLPPARGEPHPLVVFVHGGSWSYGDKAMPSATPYGILRRRLAEHGYAVASVQYRFVAVAPFPAQLADVKAAIRYLRANAAGLGLDPDRFAVAGDSAGGLLALLAGMVDPTTPVPPGAARLDLEGAVGTVGVSSSVRAAVSYYGVTDLVGLFDDRSAAGCRSGRSRGPGTAEGRLVRGDPESGPGRERAVAASPVSYAGATRTPILLLHGTTDCIVPAAQSQRLYDALRQTGAVVDLRLVPANHSARIFYQDGDLQRAVLGFLDRYVKN